MKRLCALMTAILLVCTGCSTKTGDTESTTETTGATGTTTTTTTTAIAMGYSLDDQFSDKDYEIGCIFDEYTEITLADGSSTSESNNVTVNGDVITITGGGSYFINGSLSDGQIVVDVEETEKVQLSLNGITLNNSQTAVIDVLEADKVFITTEAGTTNTLTSTIVESEDSNVDGVIFSKADVTLNGEGVLAVNSTNGNGIVTKDDLAITSGTYVVTADNHGLEANNSIRIASGDFTITSGKDGLHCEHEGDETLGYVYIANGTFVIDAQGDGIDSSATVEVENGDFNITTGGGSADVVYTGSTSGQAGMGGGTRPTMGGGMTTTPEAVGGEVPAIDEEMLADGMPPQQGGMQGGQQGGMTQQGGMAAQQGEVVAGNGVQQPRTEMATEGVAGETAMPRPTGGMTPTMDMVDASDLITDDSLSTKGIKAAKDLLITGGTFVFDTYNDAIHGDYNTSILGGDFSISAGDDAIRGGVQVEIAGGTIDIVTCYEGIEGHTIVISGGDIDIFSNDDGLNATQSEYVTDGTERSITITGGNLYVNAINAGDGFDANGNIYVSGGTVELCGTTTITDTSLDFDGVAVITGGTFIGTGSTSHTRQNFDESSSQCSIMVDFDTVQSGTVTLTDSKGNVVVSITPVKDYQSFLYSSDEIAVGETYTLTTDSETKTIVMESNIYGVNIDSHGGGGTRMGK